MRAFVRATQHARRPVARDKQEPVANPGSRPRALLFVLLPPGQAGPALRQREHLRAVLTEFGWDVTAARTLDDAARCLARGLADVFVCDLGLPLARQSQTLDRCHRANPQVPFLLLSPLASPEEAAVAARHGTVIYKPASALDLLEALQTLFHPHVTPPEPALAETRPGRRPANPLIA